MCPTCTCKQALWILSLPKQLQLIRHVTWNMVPKVTKTIQYRCWGSLLTTLLVPFGPQWRWDGNYRFLLYHLNFSSLLEISRVVLNSFSKCISFQFEKCIIKDWINVQLQGCQKTKKNTNFMNSDQIYNILCLHSVYNNFNNFFMLWSIIMPNFINNINAPYSNPSTISF